MMINMFVRLEKIGVYERRYSVQDVWLKLVGSNPGVGLISTS